MSNPEESEEPKIIIDDDWKEQVAKEKESALTGGSAGDESGDHDASPPVQSANETADYPAPPPASFEILISMMFSQGMSMLGHIPDPVSGTTNVNKPYAKHTIDTLEILGEKTKGNLSDDESKMLSEALHALRMAYVGAKP